MTTVKDRVKISLKEVTGSIGDLSTFLPLAIGLIVVNGVNATSLFLSAGLLYIATGLYYGLPVPVQPLKATSAIAITMAASPETIAATAIFIGIILLAISLLSIQGLFDMLFPRPIVRGIQLGLSILLVKAGMKAILQPGPWHAGAGNLAAPGSLHALSSLATGWIPPEWGVPYNADLYTVTLLLLPQLPLTFANSMAATTDVARSYFGERAERVTLRSLATSLGLANIVTGLIGGMPMCHGSGGLTAHYRFGARTGGANLIIGTLFVTLALFFGKSIPALFNLLPASALGVALVYVGGQHARLVRDVAGIPHELGVALGIGIMTLATGNLAVAFTVGIVLNAVGRKILRKSPRGKTA